MTVSTVRSAQPAFPRGRNHQVWFRKTGSALTSALLSLSVVADIWLGTLQCAPQRLLRTWQPPVNQQEPLPNKLLKESLWNMLNCMQPTNFNQWQLTELRHMGLWTRLLFLLSLSWRVRSRNTRATRLTVIRYDTIRYYTRCYFNVRSKADISQLKSVRQKKLKTKNGKMGMFRSNSKSLGNPCSQSWRRKGKAAVRRICRKGRF